MQCTIIEVAPRDGLQNEASEVTLQEKLSLIDRAIMYGARRIEAASFVDPRRVPQMADAEAVMSAVPRGRNVSYAGLVLNEKGAERAIASRCDELNFVVAASDSFSLRNQGTSTAGAIAILRKIAPLARRSNVSLTVTIGTAFGCALEGEIAPSKICEIAGDVCRIADEIALADTVGCAVPRQVDELFPRVRAVAPGVPLRAHFHNTRNTGIANAAAALAIGVTRLDASLGGIGGCPFSPGATGNIATEDLLYMLERSGVETGMSLDHAVGSAGWLGGVLGRRVDGMLSVAKPFPVRAS